MASILFRPQYVNEGVLSRDIVRIVWYYVEISVLWHTYVARCFYYAHLAQPQLGVHIV